jgi:abortive infection bacteriophage resistance protein
MIFQKPPITIDEQVKLLKSRGLIIQNEKFAHHTLSHISYYRLAGYWWPMQQDKEQHIFKPQSTFEDVVALYNFDRELHALLFKVIGEIEISLRTKLTYHLSLGHSPWWFQNLNLFIDVREHVKTLSSIEEEIHRSKDIFIKTHKSKYKEDRRYPPAWKTLELTTFGGLSRLYGNLKNDIKEKDFIAQEFGVVNHTYLPSWLQTLSQIRNYCAHHSRLWNRNLPGTPKLLKAPPNRWLKNVPTEKEFKHLYIHMCLAKYLLNVIHPDNNFTYQLHKLLNSYKNNIDPNALGMKQDWQNEPLWKANTAPS